MLWLSLAVFGYEVSLQLFKGEYVWSRCFSCPVAGFQGSVWHTPFRMVS